MNRKRSRAAAEKALDAIFSEWTRRRHVTADGLVQCVTCKTWRPWKEMHAGHFMSRRHKSTRWEPRNVNPQCCGCNTFNAGRQFLHGRYIDEVYGAGTADQLEALSRLPVKWTTAELEDEIQRYSDLVRKL